jgi:hypothetical protein
MIQITEQKFKELMGEAVGLAIDEIDGDPMLSREQITSSVVEEVMGGIEAMHYLQSIGKPVSDAITFTDGV